VIPLLASLRPKQWTKNFLVFAGLIFAPKLRDPDAVKSALLAFVVFCALSSVVYLINDVQDREGDRLHPQKRNRPIASGALSPQAAMAAAAVLGVLALLGAFAINTSFGVVGALYLVLQVGYSMWLKHLVILDALALAGGFVLRAIGGAVAIGVAFSNWLLLMTLLGALFIGFSKRRAEIVALADDATGHRKILAEYSPYLLDQPGNGGALRYQAPELHDSIHHLRHLSVSVSGPSARGRRQPVGNARHRPPAARLRRALDGISHSDPVRPVALGKDIRE
jgi:4-hydroxybenzoate polyprenyltransferase